MIIGKRPGKLMAKKYTPNMVENQCASSDISQSKDANATVNEKIRIPGALSFSNLSKPPVVGAIHLNRYLVQPVPEITPDSKIDKLTYHKKRNIQIGHFTEHDRIFCNIFCICPGIKAAHTKKYRNHKYGPNPRFDMNDSGILLKTVPHDDLVTCVNHHKISDASATLVKMVKLVR
jgi:hypothetical protein